MKVKVFLHVATICYCASEPFLIIVSKCCVLSSVLLWLDGGPMFKEGHGDNTIPPQKKKCSYDFSCPSLGVYFIFFFLVQMNLFDYIPWTDLVSASQWSTHVSLAVTIEIPHLHSHSMTKVAGKFQPMKLHGSSLLCISHKSALPQFTILNIFWPSDAKCSCQHSQHQQQPTFINEFQLERLLW